MNAFITLTVLLLLATTSFASGNVKLYGDLEFPDTTKQSTAIAQGPVGLQGAQGDTGPQGPQGLTGNPAISVFSSIVYNTCNQVGICYCPTALSGYNSIAIQGGVICDKGDGTFPSIQSQNMMNDWYSASCYYLSSSHGITKGFPVQISIGCITVPSTTSPPFPSPPIINSASNTTFTNGNANSFNVTAAGYPLPTITLIGTLPTGVTFNPTTNILTGTPAVGTAGTYQIKFKASNGISPDATQFFTLTIPSTPIIYSTSSSIFTVGVAGSFVVIASGSPIPTIAENGSLPDGVTFNPFTNTLGGTPTAGTTGTYYITFKASNGVLPDATQNFTLIVNSNPFSLTGNMTTPRSSHTSTLLPDGKVLIAGGSTSNAAEIYDPSTGTFTLTGNMAVYRYGHSATLLSNGKVLLIGGQSSSGPLKSAEIYDPSTGTFSTTGNMLYGFSSIIATLLPSGKVLVTGWGAYAELYDPSTGVFTATGSMLTPSVMHSATLLNNGKVLIAGGENSSGSATARAELYDPSTGTFSATGSLPSGFWGHTATLLQNTKVLIVGGNSGMGYNGSQLYDSTTGLFATSANPVSGQSNHTAILLPNGKVFIVGGNGKTPEIYDPMTAGFSSTISILTARWTHCATLLSNGKVLITGGIPQAGGLTLNSAEIYQ